MSGWLCLAVLFMGSCKPLHDREGLDPVSEPEYALSEGGVLVAAVQGKQRGMCIVRALSTDLQSATLVTERGALSEEQLKEALGFWGYPEVITVAIAGGAVGVMWAVGAPIKKRHIKFLAAGMATVLTSMGVAAGVGGIRGLSENMNWKDMFVSNTTRLKQLLSDKEEWKVTDKRMISLLDKLESIDPTYPGQCDHIDVENKHLAS